MKTLGIDIGTTSISCVVMDFETGEQLYARTLLSEAYTGTGIAWEKIQDINQILNSCTLLLDEAEKLFPDLAAIGITGQMHGILYLDRDGNAVSNLVTWEDGRGNERSADGRTYAEALTETTGYPMSSGFGLTTYYYDSSTGGVPENAAFVCTVMDLLAMKLCGLQTPVTSKSNAAGLGLFDLHSGSFDKAAVAKAGLNLAFLPEIREEGVIGRTAKGVPVVLPIGDNQAGVYGITDEENDPVLNLGTSGQISAISRVPVSGLETRPFIHGRYLILGAALCGGSALQLLNDFICRVCAEFSEGCSREKAFEVMQALAEKEADDPDLPAADTRFRGSRSDSAGRGSIGNISMANFTPGKLTLAFYRGICEEMYGYYRKFPDADHIKQIRLSGNVFRKNELMRRIAAEVFGREVKLSEYKEEAAVGAAKLAGSVLKQ